MMSGERAGELASPIRVLHITHALGMGGVETWLMELLRLWSKNGAVQMDFIATGGVSGVFDEEARRLGAKIYYLTYGRYSILHFATEFRRILRVGNYQVIHDHQDYASGWHFLMGGRALPPVRITHLHNPAGLTRKTYGRGLIRRLTVQVGKHLIERYATFIAGTSRQAIAEFGFNAPLFRRIPKGALYCGFDSRRFLGDSVSTRASVRREFGWPEDAKIVLMVGRVDQSPENDHPHNHKNTGFAICVGLKCAALDPRIHMIIAGAPSPAVSVLEARIIAAELGHRFKFVSIRKDIDRLMTGADALLFPSTDEGLGMVVVEAQAAGLPVLASSAVPRECVVVPDLVRFLNLKAGPHAWANELLDCVMQPRAAATANQKVAASQFEIENSASALFTVYSSAPPS